MRRWRILPDERNVLYSPIGLRLLDDFSGRTPNGKVFSFLEERDASGEWNSMEIEGVTTPSGVLTYPGLGRSARVAGQPVRRYRVTLIADFYLPQYLINTDGIEFDVHPYNDSTPPQMAPTHPQDALLLPASNYPFSGHVRVLRGVVEDASGIGVANVEVRESTREHVLSDQRGAFALPLRWPDLSSMIQIDALDHRNGRAGQITVNLPADLMRGHVIVIN